MPTKKKKTTTVTKTAPAEAKLASASPTVPPPVENQSGHRHVYEPVRGLGTGEAIEFCTVCADVKKV